VRGVAQLPELGALPLPDVSPFADAYDRVVALAEGSVEPPFELVADVRAAAPDAARRLTDWLYAAGRGYEAVLGSRGCRRAVDRLRAAPPSALGDASDARLAGDLLRLVAAVSALAREPVQWSAPRDQAPPAPGEVGAWLDRLEVPFASELIEMEEEEVDA
jgi:hypothetical protein